MRKRIGFKELETVNGGTRSETNMLNLTLMIKRYDDYIAVPADLDKMQKLFASKGYIFIPSENDENLIFDPNGNIYSTEDFIQIILHDFKS